MASPAVLEASATVSSITLDGSTGNKVGYIKDPLAAIENVVVTSTTALVRSDYTLAYEGDSIKITITKSGYADASCTATYNRINVSDTILTPTVFENALNSVDLTESKLGVIPNIIAAPFYSEKPTYHAKMIAKVVNRISQKWYAVCASDIISDTTADTVAEAITLKAANGYISKLDKVCWPMAKLGSYIYHLSTLAVVTMQQEDTNAEGVPYISPSNKVINASSMVTKAGTQITFDEVTANSLNQVGITTMNIVKGSLRLWGPHMANYSYASLNSINPEDRFDSSVRMMQYLLNTLQYDYLDSVDKPFSRRDVDSIKASVQQWLNGLVNEGKLLYATVDFTETSNTTADLIDGNFTFDVATTTAPNGKSITFNVQYTTEGLSTLKGGAAE
jgi:phage tail sheath protein FI